ncbi:hypothetical protein F2Q69_00049097 [Brassica cretica]|uniref:Uncharacterized protein n=1 Tax=Brassica cretica TaxID=69181 RepID=A0A8S9PMH4_BRACR|nr:hypothetical protein F2Q69_00049097 [Brassica cretica]
MMLKKKKLAVFGLKKKFVKCYLHTLGISQEMIKEMRAENMPYHLSSDDEEECWR